MPVEAPGTGQSVERAAAAEMAGTLMDSQHRGRYLWAAQFAEGRDILDAGCGTGYGTEILAAAGARRAVGMDIAQEALDAARAGSRAKLELALGNLEDLPFEDDSFDLAVCFEAIEHIEGQQTAIAELHRVLRPGGVLVLSSPNRGVYPPGNPHHVHEYESAELEQALASEFANVRLYRQSAWLAGAILDDEQSAGTGTAARQPLDVVKVGAVSPGSEEFTVALASDEALPESRALVTMGQPFEVRWWEDQVQNAVRERQLERDGRLHETRLRQEQAGALLAAERELAQAQDELAELRAREQEVRRWSEAECGRLSGHLEAANRAIADITGSLSWRITTPLRAFMRVLRRAAGS